MGHHQIVDLLLKRGDIDVNQATTTYGSTPLHRAAQHGDSELAKLLLTRKDVQVNASNKAGELHSVLQSKKVMMKLLEFYLQEKTF